MSTHLRNIGGFQEKEIRKLREILNSAHQKMAQMIPMLLLRKDFVLRRDTQEIRKRFETETKNNSDLTESRRNHRNFSAALQAYQESEKMCHELREDNKALASSSHNQHLQLQRLEGDLYRLQTGKQIEKQQDEMKRDTEKLQAQNHTKRKCRKDRRH